MGAFKVLNSSNVSLTEHVASKSWNVSGTEYKNLGISKFIINSGSIPYYPEIADLKPIYADDYSSGSYYPRLAYEGIDLEYYRATQTGSLAGSFSGSYDISLQSTITIPGTRVLSSNALVYSIPRSCFGTSIQMQSVEITAANNQVYTDNEGIILNSSGEQVGDIIYTRGLIIFTDSTVIRYLTGTDDRSLKFISNKHIYTQNVTCEVKDRELNHTYNPTAKTLISSSLEFTPYVTSIGLYNSANELLALAKLSRPVQKASNVDTTFRVQIDLA